MLLHDQHDKAFQVTEWLHRDPQDPEGILVKEEFYALIKQLEFENMQGGGGYRQLFSGAANRKRLALGFFTVFGGQCTGTLVINNYGVSLYSSLGYEAPTTLAFAAGWATVAIVGNAITAVLVDRVGRVKFLSKYTLRMDQSSGFLPTQISNAGTFSYRDVGLHDGRRGRDGIAGNIQGNRQQEWPGCCRCLSLRPRRLLQLLY